MPPIIKVIGVGGGGNNAINHMYGQNIKGVSFVVCNTDRQALNGSPVPTKVLIGPETTKGLGAGNRPEVAREAAEESANEIAALFDDDTRMVFITAGMGGGTGTGAAPVVARIAREIAEAQKQGGLQIAVVVGGGNIWRGAKASVRGMDRPTADYVGMLATVMNALSICSAVQELGVPAHVQSAIAMENVAEPYVRNNARSLLRRGELVVFAAGTGNPFFSTDTAAALRACEINAEVVMKATSVDGVYTADPKKDPTARRFDRISYDECIARELKVMDQTAFTLCKDNAKPIVVFDMHKPGNITRALLGENIGTVIS